MYYRARYYLPGCARFISEDPIGWASGQANNYAYVGDSPTNFTDPSGKLFWVPGAVILNAAIGGISGAVAAAQKCGSGGQIFAAGIGGAIAGGIIGGINPLAVGASLLGLAGGAAEIVGASALGAASGAVGEAIGSVLAGEAPSPSDIINAGAIGALGGFFGGGAAAIGMTGTQSIAANAAAGGLTLGMSLNYNSASGNVATGCGK
jgi:hypothetical protein